MGTHCIIGYHITKIIVILKESFRRNHLNYIIITIWWTIEDIAYFWNKLLLDLIRYWTVHVMDVVIKSCLRPIVNIFIWCHDFLWRSNAIDIDNILWLLMIIYHLFINFHVAYLYYHLTMLAFTLFMFRIIVYKELTLTKLQMQCVPI
jgi:hypothetical protein